MSTSDGQGGRGGNDRGRGPNRPRVSNREMRRLRQDGNVYNDLITTFSNAQLLQIVNDINRIYGATTILTDRTSDTYFSRNAATAEVSMIRMLEAQLVVIRALGRLTATVRQQIPVGHQAHIRSQLPRDDRFTALAADVEEDIDELQQPQQFNPAGGQPLIQLPPAPSAGPVLTQGPTLDLTVPNPTLSSLTNSLNQSNTRSQSPFIFHDAQSQFGDEEPEMETEEEGEEEEE